MLLPLFLLALFHLGNTQSLFHNATDALAGWDDLAKDAGYFTQSGRWKGGLPRRQRSTNNEAFACDRTHRNGGFCLGWSGGSAADLTNGDDASQEVCNCTLHDDLFCQAWECRRSSQEAPCRRTSLACIEDENTRITNCVCERGDAQENPICQQWICLEYSIYGPDEMQSFVCLHEDASMNYCFRWRGNISSSDYLKSTVCDCYSREEDHCDLWLCEERIIDRCAVLDHGMCDTGFAVGVYGGLGMVILLAFMIWAFVIWIQDRKKGLLALGVFGIGFFVTVLPWMIGVALTGGVFAIGWVILLWSVPIFLAAQYLLFTSSPIKESWNCCKPRADP